MAAALNDTDACRLGEENTPVCSLCVKEVSKYTCPRCNVRYCSVACYRGEKHLSCSEAFYKNCVLDEIKEIKASPEERQQILEMLERTAKDYDMDSDDCEEDEDLEARIAGLDLDNDTDEIWQRLSDKEKKEFHAMVRDGRVANLVEVWTPWWNQDWEVQSNLSYVASDGKQQMWMLKTGGHITQESRFVSEIDGDSTTVSSVPAALGDITDINQLIKNRKVSSDVRHSVVNVLFAYAFVSRLHNGGHLDLALDSAQDMLSVSAVLGSPETYSTVGEAIHACIHNVYQLEKVRERDKFQQFTVSVIEDVRKIVEGPAAQQSLLYTTSALSDVHRVLTAASKLLSKDIKDKRTVGRGDNPKNLKKQLFLAVKKVEFLLSWCQRFGMALHPLCQELELEFCALSSDLHSVSATKDRFEETWGGVKPPPKTKLIEEMPSSTLSLS